jgi:hypothetical protein
LRPLGAAEIVDLERYAGLRPDYRAQVIAYKRGRRMAVGENVSLVFEDRETLRFQVQEMLWIERLREPARVQQELDVYNELMPGPGELSATLFIEITERAEIRPELDRLIGLDECVFLVLGEGADEDPLRARFDPKQRDEDRIAAVQYLRFELGEARAARFRDPRVRARIRIDHPSYRREDEIPEGVRTHLTQDLTRDPESLLRPGDDAPANAPRDELLARSPLALLLRPAQPRFPGHLVVEAADPSLDLLRASPEQLAELLALVQRAVREVLREHGGARVTFDAGPGTGRLRWHVYARS